MSKSRKLIIVLFIFISLGLFVIQVKAQDASDLKSEMNSSLQDAIQSQKEADKWSQEKASLVSRIRQVKTRLKWHKYQNEKYEAYIQNERKTISELQEKKDEMKRLRMKLEPYLANVVKDLDQFVQSDYSFLTKERKERLKFLRKTMDDYHISLDEKLRRILEALQVEAEYGTSVETRKATLQIDDKKMQVELLRIGRIAKFYRSSDGRHVGRWSEEKEKWVELPGDYSRSIRRALDMANQKQTVKLVDLPIGGLE